MSLLIVGNGDMLQHQFNDPVNKNAQLGVDMAVRWKRQVQRLGLIRHCVNNGIKAPTA